MARNLDSLNAVVSKLLSIRGIVDVWPVEATERTAILRMEEKASESAAHAALMIANEGGEAGFAA